MSLVTRLRQGYGGQARFAKASSYAKATEDRSAGRSREGFSEIDCFS